MRSTLRNSGRLRLLTVLAALPFVLPSCNDPPPYNPFASLLGLLFYLIIAGVLHILHSKRVIHEVHLAAYGIASLAVWAGPIAPEVGSLLLALGQVLHLGATYIRILPLSSAAERSELDAVAVFVLTAIISICTYFFGVCLLAVATALLWGRF